MKSHYFVLIPARPHDPNDLPSQNLGIVNPNHCRIDAMVLANSILVN